MLLAIFKKLQIGGTAQVILEDFQAEHLGVDSKEQRSGRLRLESSVLYLGIKPLAVLQLALARRIFLGNASSPRLATETTKESILWLIICSTDWRAI